MAPSAVVSLFQRQRVVLPWKYWRILWELSATNIANNWKSESRNALRDVAVDVLRLLRRYHKLLRGRTLGYYRFQVLILVGLGTVIDSHVNFMALYYCYFIMFYYA